jgi:hypothetical protein
MDIKIGIYYRRKESSVSALNTLKIQTLKFL